MTRKAAGSSLEDGEGAGGVQANVAGEFEALGEHGAMEPEDEGLTGGYLKAGAAEGGGSGLDGGGVSGGGLDEHLHGVRKAGEYGGDFGGTGEAEEDTATGGGDGVFGVETNHAGRLSGWIRIVAIDGICRREEAGGERAEPARPRAVVVEHVTTGSGGATRWTVPYIGPAIGRRSADGVR